MGNMFDITPPAGTESPFNSNEPDGDWGEGEDLPPIPVGVLRASIIKAEKATNGKDVLTIKCNDPNYANSEELSFWPEPAEKMAMAALLGIVVRQEGNRIYYQDSEGNTGLKAFEGKAGMFIFAPFTKDGLTKASLGRYGAPKPKKSELWDAYWEQHDFGEKQTAALKKARVFVVSPEHFDLFNE
jgi:hypothetical protein